MLHDATPDLAGRLAAGPITAYVGFDPTADSLHVGHLIPVMALAWLQRHGGTPIVLVGGGTGMVGDPSGKRAERPMLSTDDVGRNAEALRQQLSHFLEFGEGEGQARMRNNAEWLHPLGLLEFLRDAGKHFTISYMLQKDTVKSRLETGISFTEFSYMLVQAYDFAHLGRTEGCELQMGGSDQWGNITAGIELGAKRDGRKLHGATLTLLTTAAGTKFGKSEGGNVWLDPVRTSPYAFHQFWLRSEDADVERLLRFFTFKPLDEVAELMTEHVRDPSQRVAQRALADDVTARIHGAEAVARAGDAAAILFGSGDVAAADAATLAMVLGEIPAAPVSRSELQQGITLVDAMERCGLVPSRGEARRLLASGSVSVNGAKVEDVTMRLTAERLLHDRAVLLRRGKRQWAALTVTGE